MSKQILNFAHKTRNKHIQDMGRIGVWEIILIVLVILLFFGAKRIPELMKSIGKGVRSFKDGISDIEKEVNAKPDETETDNSGK